MRSTPIRALLSETGEVPLHIRRTSLAAKLATKLLLRTDDRITHQLLTIYTMVAQNPRYWRNTGIPAMVEVTDLTIYYYNYIYKADKLPCFDFLYYLQTLKLNFTKVNLTKDTHNERSFINKIKEVVLDCHLVFTDASVETANHTCGIGIYGEDLDISPSGKQLLSKNKTQKLAVVPDSLSALQAITKQGVDKKQDYITLSTREEIQQGYDLADNKDEDKSLVGRPQLGNRCYSQALEASKRPANIKSLCMSPTSKAMTYIVKELIKSRIKI
nr:unnamed protein product [Callosobruchus analis]